MPSLRLSRLEEGTLCASFLLRFEVLLDLARRLNLRGCTLSLRGGLRSRLFHELDGLANDLGFLVLAQFLVHKLFTLARGHFPASNLVLQALPHVIHTLLQTDLALELMAQASLVRRTLGRCHLGILRGSLQRRLHCRCLFRF